MKKFDKLNTVVTGAAAGLGSTVAVEMAREGANLILLDVADCADTLAAIAVAGGSATAIRCDISKEADVVAAAARVGELFSGRLDILINNAGLNGKASLIKDMKLEDWNRTIGVNLTGTMMVCRELVRYMPAGSKIVNVSSNVGKRGLPYRADYVCSKWAIIGLTQTLALELAPAIRVNAVCPGPIEGDRIEQLLQMHAEAEGMTYEQAYKAWADVPLGRFIEPQEVAEVIKFLASERSSAMTGQALNVTGGLIMS